VRQVYIESMIVEVTPQGGRVRLPVAGPAGQQRRQQGLVAAPTSGTSGNNIIDLTSTPAGGTGHRSGAGRHGLNIGLLQPSTAHTAGCPGALLQTQSRHQHPVHAQPDHAGQRRGQDRGRRERALHHRQFTNTGTGATVNPFQTIERKDVGITLRIKPQIGEGGAVRMTIFQESSSRHTAPDRPARTNAGPTTDKRSIETTVVVDDGQILVLGGLIEGQLHRQREQGAAAGRHALPVGNLFRSESRDRKRTNLMVFLRPIVMRDADAAAA
jgi:general secretion pathway protein D